jgi:hypothetical protein
MVKKVLISVALLGTLFVLEALAASNVIVRIHDSSVYSGDNQIEVPITVSDVTGLGIIAADIQLVYDASRLSFLALSKNGSIASNWGNPVFNKNIPGQLNIAFYGVTPIKGKGVLLKVYFNVNPQAVPGEIILKFKKFKFNDGRVASLLKQGKIRILISKRSPKAKLK